MPSYPVVVLLARVLEGIPVTDDLKSISKIKVVTEKK